MSKFVLFATIKAKPGKADLVKTELAKLIAPSRAEAGCIQYDMTQDNSNPELFMAYEIWETREAWQAHMKTEHLTDLVKNTEGCMELTVNETTLMG